MLLEVHQGDGAQVSFHLAPLWRLSAFLFDLSLHMKNLNLIFPSWAKLEEGQCFIKGFFIPQAATVFFIYIQRKSVFLFLRKCFQKLSLRKVNPIVPNSKKGEKRKPDAAPPPLGREQGPVLISSLGTNETPPRCRAQGRRPRRKHTHNCCSRVTEHFQLKKSSLLGLNVLKGIHVTQKATYYRESQMIPPMRSMGVIFNQMVRPPLLQLCRRSIWYILK